MMERNERIRHAGSAHVVKWSAGAVGWFKRHWILLVSIAALLLTYTLLGFFLVPYLARNAIEGYVQNDMQRRVTIGDITFNPFTLTARAQRVALAEANGEPIASVGALLVNLELSSLFHLAPTFKEVRIDQPRVHLVILPDRSVNLAKLAPKKSAEPAKPTAIPHIRIGSFAVHRGSLAFEDRSREELFTTTLTPIEFALADFRTEPRYENAYHFSASTPQHESFEWTGEFSVQPVGSTGRFNVNRLQATTIAAYLQDTLPFDLRSGSLDITGSYALKLEGGLDLNIKLPTVKTQDVALAPREDGAQPWITLKSADVSDVALALATQRVTIGDITLNSAKVDVWRESDGQVNLLRLFKKPQASTPPSAPAAQTATAKPASPWQLGVNTIALKDASVSAEDRSVQPAVHVNLTPINVTVNGFSTAANAPMKIESDIGIDEHGHLVTSGDITAQPLAANLDIGLTDLDLTALQPYIASQSDVVLKSGRAGAKTHVTYAAEPQNAQAHLKLTGEVQVLDLLTKDKALEEDLVKWREVDVTGLEYTFAPDALSIQRIRAVKPYGRVIITSNRTLNLKEVLKPARVEQQSATSSAPKVAADKQQPMPMRIRTIMIEDGSANFADYSVQPSFATGIQGLKGSIDGLSSNPKSRANIKLVGSVDRYAPVSITGEANLLSATMYTDVAMDFRNMDLTTFNPYSGKYAGYDISKGKLSTRLNYKIRDRTMDAQHHIVVDQLEFGKETGSKDAVPIPVKLAVSLLKDRNGVITLDLPVSGNLDDPEFKLGPLVWKVVINLLTKAVTAPFALLGSLFGGNGEELSYVNFTPGSAELAPQESEKLGKLGHALSERPQLKLNVPSDIKEAADAEAYARSALDQALANAGPKKATADAEAAQKQHLAALKTLYKKELKRALPEVSTDDPQAEAQALEKDLLERYTPTPIQLTDLAHHRAESVRDAIVRQTQIDPERIYFTAENTAAKNEDGKIRVELKLE